MERRARLLPRGVRRLTLLEESWPTSPKYCALLFVAEISSKTIYNASSPVDPFDEESPWWLFASARSFVQAVGDEVFGRSIWRALTGDDAGPPAAAADGARRRR